MSPEERRHYPMSFIHPRPNFPKIVRALASGGLPHPSLPKYRLIRLPESRQLLLDSSPPLRPRHRHIVLGLRIRVRHRPGLGRHICLQLRDDLELLGRHSVGRDRDGFRAFLRAARDGVLLLRRLGDLDYDALLPLALLVGVALDSQDGPVFEFDLLGSELFREMRLRRAGAWTDGCP